jgi:hypothetical protein
MPSPSQHGTICLVNQTSRTFGINGTTMTTKALVVGETDWPIVATTVHTGSAVVAAVVVLEGKAASQPSQGRPGTNSGWLPTTC